MNSTSLDARIRSVRQGVRSHQPLDYRIQLVRERYQALKEKSRKRTPVRREHHR